MKKIYAFIFALALLACENDPFEWGDYTYARVAGPEIWTLGSDSLLYTFSIRPADMTEFVVEAEVIIMGKTADRPRTVAIAVDPEHTTAIKGAHYDLPESVAIPAGEASAPLHIRLYRSADLQSTSVRLRVKIAATGDIGPGVTEWTSLSIAWNDMITRPLNWDDLIEFFGQYSEVKYRFIISTLGIAEFPYGNGMDWGMMNNYRLVLVEALAAYNAAHPSSPLVDENFYPITF